MSLLTYDFFFTIPKYSFTMKDPKEIINVLVFLFTAIIIGQLVKIVKKQNIALQLRLERVALIEEMSKEFLTLPPLEQLVEGLAAFSQETMNTLAFLRTTIINDISNITIKNVQKVINVPCFVLFKEKKGDLQLWSKSSPDLEINQNDLAVAKWTFSHGEIAGAGTETLPSIPYCFLPIKSQEEEILGIVGIKYEFKNLLPEQRRILGTISNLTSHGGGPLGENIIKVDRAVLLHLTSEVFASVICPIQGQNCLIFQENYCHRSAITPLFSLDRAA